MPAELHVPLVAFLPELQAQAVLAAQGAAGLGRDGVVGPATRRALDRGVMPAVRSKGDAVEIDISAGTITFVRAGRPWRVLHTSTGNGARYESGDTMAIARTPRGSFSVQRRIDGVRVAPLGNRFMLVLAADQTEELRLAGVRRDFVANVSHELKTPIGALQLLAEALLDATGNPDGGFAGGAAVPAERAEEDLAAARRFAQRIQHESGRLGRLVEELLELTRLQGADARTVCEPVAMDWVVAEVLDRTRTTAAAAQIAIVTSGRPGLKVYGDANQIATALENLVGNAIKYSGAGTTVTVDVGSVGEYVKIAVTDQGAGIGPDDLPRVFERFYRTDQARSRATGGTGLGLAIVKHIAGNHGGRIEVASTLGGGSTFTLSLPARPPEELLAAVVPDWDELPDGSKRKFDIGTAFKCISAHRAAEARAMTER